MGLPTVEAPGAYRKAIGVLNRPVTAADAKALALQQQLEQASMLKLRSRDALPISPGAVFDLTQLSAGSSSVGDAASAIGSSASGMSAAAALAMLKEAAAEFRSAAGSSAASVTLGTPPGGAALAKCMFCGRPGGPNGGAQCLFVVDPTKPCREARQGLELHRVQAKAAKAKAAAAAPAGATKE